MSLSEPAAIVIAAVVTSVGTGATSWGLRKRKPKRVSPDRMQVALEKRVKELETALAAQTEKQIARLEAECEDQRRTIAALRGEGQR